MNYRTLGRTGLAVSTLGFGALEIGRNWPYWREQKDDFSRPNETDAIGVIHKALDLGVNFFDTAPAYQDSERIIGKAFKGIRNEVFIGTKCGEWFDGKNSVYDYSYAETMKFVDNSLRLLQTDYVDLLQIHSANMDVIKRGETLAAMKEVQKIGKTRFLGLSTDDVAAAREAIRTGEYDAVQVSFNALNLLFAKEVFPAAQEKNLGIIIKDGMARGKLTSKFADVTDPAEFKKIGQLRSIAEQHGMDLSELALRYVVSDPRVSSVIVGTKKKEHLQSNAALVNSERLPGAVLSMIEEINS